jgi:hypothetical protein
MAKGKKQPEQSKKATQKQKEKKIDDLTFGLKNKAKSAKVQQYVKSTEKAIKNEGMSQRARQLDEQKKQAKLAHKAKKKAELDERNDLFSEALLAVSKKTDKKAGKVEAKGRDADDDVKKSGTSRAMKMMFQMDAQEMQDKLREDPNYVPTLEDEVELKRQEMFAVLKKEGKKGTPVTEASLNEWLAKKRKKRADDARKKVEAEFKKKKGGKGLSVLTGRDLYEYNKELFVDDENAADATDTAGGGRTPSDAGSLNGEENENSKNGDTIEKVVERIETDLFLNEDDDDLDDLDED